jgi:hypothetical protein
MIDMNEIEEKPFKNPEIMWNRIGDTIVVFYPEEYIIAELNSISAYIWELCDGNNTLCSMASSLCAKFNVSPEIAKNDLYELIREFKRMDLLKV